MTIQSKNNHIIPRLKILGVGSLKTRTLKANLLEALEAMELNLPLLEVEGVNELMQYDIIGIPAIVLDDDILIQKEVPSVEVLVEILEPFFEHKNENGTD